MTLYRNLLLILLSLSIFSCSKESSSTNKNDNNSTTSATEAEKAGNLLQSGDSANDILSNTNYDKIIVEIGYVTGLKPTAEAIDEFTDFLRARTFKENIEVIYKELDSPSEDELTLNEIANLESENRTAYNKDRTLAFYIYFADTGAEGDDIENGLVTLGAVYRNTSMIVHEATIRELVSRSNSISNADVESATLNHEFGHLFGLVNLGTNMVNDHEDKSQNSEGNQVGNKHCNTVGCLMRAELQFRETSTTARKRKSSYEDGIKAGCTVSANTIIHLLQSKTAKGARAVYLDTECLLDLAANGGR